MADMDDLQAGIRRGRPRKAHRPAMRNVTAQVPYTDADLFADTCELLGISAASVLRTAMYDFLAAHPIEEIDQPQEAMPLTG